jgi:hypothetical protein
MRLRFIWYAVVIVGWLLSFFGILEMPKNWAATMTAFAPIEAWWDQHAAHPILAAFFAGLFFATVFLPEAWSHFWNYLRPSLDIEFDPDNTPGCRFDEGKGWVQFRMVIGNFRSRKTAHNCEGKVLKIESRFLSQSYEERVPLTWSYKEDLDRADIQDGGSLFLNIIVIGQATQGQTASFITTSDANNAAHPFNVIGEYKCTTVVSSEETGPAYVSFIFDWTGNATTAKISNVRVFRKTPHPIKWKKAA